MPIIASSHITASGQVSGSLDTTGSFGHLIVSGDNFDTAVSSSAAASGFGTGGGGGISTVTQTHRILSATGTDSYGGDYWDVIWGSYNAKVKYQESDTSRTAGWLYKLDESTSTSTGPYSLFEYHITRKSGANYVAPTKVQIKEVFAAGSCYLRAQNNLVLMFLICNDADAYRPYTSTTSEAQARIPVGMAVFTGGNADAPTANAWSRGCKTGSIFSGHSVSLNNSGSATNTMGSDTPIGFWSCPTSDQMQPSRSHIIQKFGLTDTGGGGGNLVSSSGNTNVFQHPSWDSDTSTAFHEPDGQFYFKAEASTWTDPQYHVTQQTATGTVPGNMKDYLHRSGSLILEKGDLIVCGIQHHHDGTQDSGGNDWYMANLQIIIKTEEVD